MKKEKIIKIIFIALIVGISGIIIISNKVKNSKLLLNEPIVENIKEDVELNDLDEITVIDARIEKLEKTSYIFIKIKNNTNEVINKRDLKLTIKDKDDNILLVSYIKDVEELKTDEERGFQFATDNDIKDAFKYIIEKGE